MQKRRIENAHPANAWLRTELAKRQSKNPRYSLRSFAKAVGVGPGRVSEWLSDTRQISMTSIREVAEKLGYSFPEIQVLLDQFFHLKSQNTLARSNQKEWRTLLQDQLELICDPIHDSILELTRTRDFKDDPAWISKRLRVSTQQVRVALDRLIQAGLLSKGASGKLFVVDGANETQTDVPSRALREHHRRVMENALLALEEVPVLDRDITSITVAIDKKRLTLAKQMIRDFRRNLASLMSVGSQDEVYRLSVQFVPVSFSVHQQKKEK